MIPRVDFDKLVGTSHFWEKLMTLPLHVGLHVDLREKCVQKMFQFFYILYMDCKQRIYLVIV